MPQWLLSTSMLSAMCEDCSRQPCQAQMPSVREKIAVVGTVLPSQAKSLITDDTIREGFLWNPTDAGYAMVAVAKLVLDYPQIKFTDYMTLLKVDGEWKIINKTFYAEPKTNAKP